MPFAFVSSFQNGKTITNPPRRSCKYFIQTVVDEAQVHFVTIKLHYITFKYKQTNNWFQ